MTDYKDNCVYLIDATNSVKTTVPVGNVPYGVAVTPNGKKVYVANFDDNTVSVIDTTSNTITATVTGLSNPSGVAVNPDGTMVYVTNYNDDTIDDTVSVIDTATDTVTATVNGLSNPCGVTVAPGGTKVYVANRNSNKVSVIDTATNTVKNTISVGSDPHGVAVNPTGTKVYVANYKGNSVSVIDAATNKVTATVPVGSAPFGVAVTKDEAKVYVANRDSNTVSVIDTATNTVIATVKVGNHPKAFGQFIGAAEVTPPKPLADFTSSVKSGYVPLKVSFYDKSTGTPTSWSWDFGDGAKSTDQNPMHTYTNAGDYQVKLIVGNEAGSSNKINYLDVDADPAKIPEQNTTEGPTSTQKPLADFTSSVKSGYVPLKVSFYDKSTGTPTSWSWDFGDGAKSTDQDPMHTYTNAGDYQVKLIVGNEAGSSNKINYLDVDADPAKIPEQNTTEEPTSNKSDIAEPTGPEPPNQLDTWYNTNYFINCSCSSTD